MHEKASLDSISAMLRDFESTTPEKGTIWMCLETVLDSTPFGVAQLQHGTPECTPKDSLPLVTRLRGVLHARVPPARGHAVGHGRVLRVPARGQLPTAPRFFLPCTPHLTLTPLTLT
jgi:hypothetical protein